MQYIDGIWHSIFFPAFMTESSIMRKLPMISLHLDITSIYRYMCPLPDKKNCIKYKRHKNVGQEAAPLGTKMSAIFR